VYLQSVNVAIRVNSLYRTEVRHIQTNMFLFRRKRYWLSVRVVGIPRWGTRNSGPLDSYIVPSASRFPVNAWPTEDYETVASLDTAE
jgi:hypothetical protein